MYAHCAASDGIPFLVVVLCCLRECDAPFSPTTKAFVDCDVFCFLTADLVRSNGELPYLRMFPGWSVSVYSCFGAVWTTVVDEVRFLLGTCSGARWCSAYVFFGAVVLYFCFFAVALRLLFASWDCSASLCNFDYITSACYGYSCAGTGATP